MHILIASTVSCVLGLGCDLSDSLQRKIRTIPQVKNAIVVEDYGLEGRYHARITLNTGDTFDLAYFFPEHLSKWDYFRIIRINGWQHDYVFCEKPQGSLPYGRIQHGQFSVGARGSYQGKFSFSINNIQDVIERFPAIKAEYFRAPEQPKFIHDFLPKGEEVYATLFNVGDKYPLGPTAQLSGEPFKNAWEFKGRNCKHE